jgi:hypothetical protein
MNPTRGFHPRRRNRLRNVSEHQHHNVRSIGCHTASWGNAVSVRSGVKSALRRTPALESLVESALRRHGQRMPVMLQRGTDHTTPVDLDALHFREPCSVITLCTPHGKLHTIVALASDL